MDNVPQRFVDAVIGLFGERGLGFIVKLDDSMWSRIGELHVDNRRKFNIDIRKVGGEFVFNFNEFCPGRGGSLLIQPSEFQLLKPHYLRICSVGDVSASPSEFRDEELLRVGEGQIQTFLSQIAKYIGNNCHLQLTRTQWGISGFSERVASHEEFADFSQLILRAFYKRAYFNSVSLSYVGSESEDFLKDHIYNNPHLSCVRLAEDWPPSTLSDVRYFIREGKDRRVSLPPKFRVDKEFIIELFEFWKSDRQFQCRLSYGHQPESPPFLETMTQLSTNEDVFYLKHDIQTSAAMYCFGYICEKRIYLSFKKCSCNVSKHCSFCSRVW